MLVVFNDTQLYRNCDEEALGAFLTFVRDHKDQITHVVANGDITDYEQQSKFSKMPDVHDQAIDEINATKWLFTYLSELLPNAQKFMVIGNHDLRWENMLKDQNLGLEHWVKTPDDMFEWKKLGWKVVGYGRGDFYRWHDRIFWHGHRAGKKSNIPKLEMEDAGQSTTTAHINRNMFFETTDAFGRYHAGVTHGGFSKNNLAFVKSANSGWSQGFGVYYWNPLVGEQPYLVVMKHGNPRFIFNGKTYDGTGFSIMEHVEKAAGGRVFL